MSRSSRPRQTEKKAIFYQRSKALQNEFALINLVTVREAARSKLDKLLRDIKIQSRVCDQPCMAEVFNLIDSVREATYDLVDSVAVWQQGFTQNIRPQLMNIDYLVEMIWSMEFVSATHLRREFRFQLGAGNFMLLPLPTVGRKQKPYVVSKELAQALHRFANPIEHRLLKCYHILLGCMPKETYKKAMQLNYWMNNRWKPNIELDGWVARPKEENLDLLTMLLRGMVPPTAQSAAAVADESSAAVPVDDTQIQNEFGGDDEFASPGSPNRKASVYGVGSPLQGRKASVAAGGGSASPSSSPLRASYTLEIPVPGGSVLIFEKKEDIFSPGGGVVAPEGLLPEYFSARAASPLRPPRGTRAESPEMRKRQNRRAKLLAEGKEAEEEIFSDDSEDERIKRDNRDKKKLYKRPEQKEEDTSPGRVRREKALAEAKTIEEKAARMSFNTNLLRDTWLGVEPSSSAVTNAASNPPASAAEKVKRRVSTL